MAAVAVGRFFKIPQSVSAVLSPLTSLPITVLSSEKPIITKFDYQMLTNAYPSSMKVALDNFNHHVPVQPESYHPWRYARAMDPTSDELHAEVVETDQERPVSDKVFPLLRAFLHGRQRVLPLSPTTVAMVEELRKTAV